MKLKQLTQSVVLAFAAMAGSSAALAANSVAYMNNGEPWGSTTNTAAMNAAFGTGNWDKISFGASIANYSFVYIDGGAAQGTSFKNYVTANQAALESYVLGGGHLFLNAATWNLGGTTYDLLFGTTTTEGGNGYSSTGYASVPTSPLFTGAGTSWSGSWFAHNVLGSAAGFTTYITGDSNEIILEGGAFGSGYVLLGGQTNTNFHSGINGSNPFQLRVNELSFAATTAAVPEPESYALMLAGLGLMGAVARRRKSA